MTRFVYFMVAMKNELNESKKDYRAPRCFRLLTASPSLRKLGAREGRNGVSGSRGQTSSTRAYRTVSVGASVLRNKHDPTWF